MVSRYAAFLVAFIFVFAANNSEENRNLAGTFLDNAASWDGREINEYTAEQVWSYCEEELKGSTEAVSDLDSDGSQSTTGGYSNVELDSTLAIKNMQKMAIAHLPPKKKEIILDCMREKKYQLQVSQDEQGSLFDRHEEPKSGSANFPRRYLRRKKHPRHIVRTAPTPGPALSPASLKRIRQPLQVVRIAPTPGLASSPAIFATAPISQGPGPSPSPLLQPPSPDLQPPADSTEPYPPSANFNSPSPSDVSNPSRLPKNVSPVPPQNSNLDRKYIFAAVVVSSVIGLTLVAVFLFCCLKKSNNKKIEPKDGQRDEKPLLNFYGGNISAGSSANSQSMGKDFKAPPTTSSSIIAVSGSAQGQSQSTKAFAESFGKNDPVLPLPPGKAPPPPPGPPAPPPKPPAPAPPPPPKVVRRPPNPPAASNVPKPSLLGPHHQGSSSAGDSSEVSDESGAPKTKLKPFFWDKVMANPDHSMVWHEIKAGSFQFNEEMMETLFGYAPADKNKKEHGKELSTFESPPQFIQIIDPKKSQNLAILLKALNVTTEEVCEALREGNELPAELIQTLLKMAPTTDEELKLRLYSGDVSHLGPAERFLKVMVEIPFAFKRLESLLFVSTFQEEVYSIKESLATLEVACKELRNSRLFLKLLEAVLKTGNRMNDGTYRGGAQAFKLDTLLKLSDVKGIDGKTTLLHFVVNEIIRSEGLRAARRLRESRSMSSVKTEDLVEDSSHETEEYHRSLGLQVVSGLSNELENVRKAAPIDTASLSESVFRLGQSLAKTREFLDTELKSVDGENDFHDALANFVNHSESDVAWLREEEKRIMALVKSTGNYFHGKAMTDEGLHLFVIVRDFLVMLDKACKDVKHSTKLPSNVPRKEASTASPSQDSPHGSSLDGHRQLFPAIRERQMDEDFSSDDER